MARPTESVAITDDIVQKTAEIASLIFFMVMLGELAYSQEHKNKILKFYGVSK